MSRDKSRQSKSNIVSLAMGGDRFALTKLLSQIEDDIRKNSNFLSKVPASPSLKIGITGPPGAGKSTFVGQLIKFFRDRSKKVAVLAIDPSSPFSGGALLGDRVRMNEHSADSGVFIRSVGVRGSFGGISTASGAMGKALELCGFDVIIFETAGVGQTEFQIKDIVDVTLLLLVPESGDVIQTLKAGILEVADVIAVNKSDRPGAEILVNELKQLAESANGPQIFTTIATQSKGIDEVASAIELLAQKRLADKKYQDAKLKGQLRIMLLAELASRLDSKVKNLKVSNLYEAYKKIRIPKF